MNVNKRSHYEDYIFPGGLYLSVRLRVRGKKMDLQPWTLNTTSDVWSISFTTSSQFTNHWHTVMFNSLIWTIKINDNGTHLNGISWHDFTAELLRQSYAEFRFSRARAPDDDEQRTVVETRIHLRATVIDEKRQTTTRRDSRFPGHGRGKNDGFIAF